MIRPFDMELFLVGVLTGSHATRQRHLRQAKTIQAAISDRWYRDNPWTWQHKHLTWFLNQQTAGSHHYYLLTSRLIVRRLGKKWILNTKSPDRKLIASITLMDIIQKNFNSNYQVGILNNLPELPSSCSTRASSYSENTMPSGTSESIVVKIY